MYWCTSLAAFCSIFFYDNLFPPFASDGQRKEQLNQPHGSLTPLSLSRYFGPYILFIVQRLITFRGAQIVSRSFLLAVDGFSFCGQDE
jgi:hypothetical protein